MATAFADAQSKRHDADYDLNSELYVADATVLLERVEQAIGDWSSANLAADRDFKNAIFILMLQKGTLRKEA